MVGVDHADEDPNHLSPLTYGGHFESYSDGTTKRDLDSGLVRINMIINGMHIATRIRNAAPIVLSAFLLVGCSSEENSSTAAQDSDNKVAAKATTPAPTKESNLTAAKPQNAAAAEKTKINPTPLTKPTILTREQADSISLDRQRNLPDAPSGLTQAPTNNSKPGPQRSKSNIEDLMPLDITFEPDTLELGLMQPGVPKTGIIMLVNNGKESVQIKKAIASCGCTTPNWPREPIAPGESAKIEITLKPSLKQGQKLSKRVTLQMVNGPPQVLKVEGEVGLFVRVSPDFLDAGKKSEDGQNSIILDSADETPFAIVSIDPDVTTGFDSEKGLHHELTMDWDKWETLGRRPQVKIRTDHPNAPEMSMVVRRAVTNRTPRAPQVTQQRSSLVTAAQQNNIELLKAALGVDGDKVNDNSGMGGMSALHWAAKNGNPEMTLLLIQAGADPNVKSKVGKTPMTVAAESGKVEVLEVLVENGGTIEAIDQIGGSPLLWAAGLSPSSDTLEYLIKVGGNVNLIDTNGMTPLIWAAGIGQPSSVKTLIDNGADLEVVEIHQKETALMRAARIGKPETLGYLIDAGANLNVRNALGHNALLIASSSAPVGKVQMLVDAGSDVSAIDIRGWTALDHAKTRTDAGRIEVIEYLESVMPAPQAPEVPAEAPGS